MTDSSDPRDRRRADMDPGLALRFPSVVRRVVGQHEQLEEFAQLVHASVERGSLRAARQAFTSFTDALTAHITLEDQTVFPAVRGLHPGLISHLSELVTDHDRFRVRLDELHDSLARGFADEFRRGFDAFCAEFSAHEAREEKVVAGIDPK